jgi:hypothetical protein
VSNARLEDTLEQAGIDDDVIPEVIDTNEKARIVALRVSLAVVAFTALLALFFARALPPPCNRLTNRNPPGEAPPP